MTNYIQHFYVDVNTYSCPNPDIGFADHFKWNRPQLIIAEYIRQSCDHQMIRQWVWQQNGLQDRLRAEQSFIQY